MGLGGLGLGVLGLGLGGLWRGDGWADGCTEIPPVFYRTLSPSGPQPKKGKNLENESKDIKREPAFSTFFRSARAAFIVTNYDNIFKLH